MNIALAITAAGKSVRFGSDKLQYPITGSSMGETCLALFSQFQFVDKVIVLNSQDSFMYQISAKYGYRQVINFTPEHGLSGSVKLAVKTILDSYSPEGIMFATADMPFILPESIRRLIALFEDNPNCICAPFFKNAFGKPVLFPNWSFHELMNTTGDIGGRLIIKDNVSKVRTIAITEKETIDIDTLADAEKWIET